jgi:hypothetical protein
MRRPLIALLLLTVAVVALGCGDGGGQARDDYQDQINGITKQLQTSLSGVEAPSAGASRQQNIAALQRAEDAFTAAVRSLKAVTPPKGTESAHRKLIAGLSELAATYRKGIRAVRRGDLAALAALAPQLGTSSDAVGELEAARKELADIGVEISTGTPGS